MKYIPDPLLIHGKKFDFRLWVLVSEMNPLKIYLYNEAFVRFTTENYSLNKNTISKKNIHITNFSIQKYSNKFYIKGFDDEDGNLWSLSTFRKYLKRQGINWNPIWDKIKDIFIKYFAMYTKNVFEIEKANEIKNRMFNIWGMDIILDNNYNPYLLEGNYNCLLEWEFKWVDEVLKEMIKDAFNIIGLRSFDRNDGSIYYKTRTFQEIIDESICEMTRPTGAYERIFPKIDNIDYYKKFIHPSEENQKLWEEMKNLNITS